MDKYYKGQRISELLENIRRLEIQLHENQEVVGSLEDAIALVEGQATLAIAKAKLTALLGE
jgi:hypothetical protein